MNKLNRYIANNNIKIITEALDYAETKVEISEISLNLLDYVHGGLYFSLADAAAGISSWSNGTTYVTLNSSFSFIKAVKEGYLIAKATVISRTAKICVVDVVVVDQNDHLCSKGTFTMFAVKKR